MNVRRCLPPVRHRRLDGDRRDADGSYGGPAFFSQRFAANAIVVASLALALREAGVRAHRADETEVLAIAVGWSITNALALGALSVETIAFVDTWPTSSLGEHGQFALSILWIVYAAITFFAGLARHDALWRRVGLAILSLTVLKVFVYDLSFLGLGLRVISFGRYAIAASVGHTTHLARFRDLVRRYPTVKPKRILADLVASTPGEEGKWFASALSLKLTDVALELARLSRTDPKTLSRAAEKHAKTEATFAMEVALLALQRFAEGFGFDVTRLDIRTAYAVGRACAETLDRTTEYRERVQALVTGGDRFTREALASVQ